MTTTRTNEHLITSLSTESIAFPESTPYTKRDDDHQVTVDSTFKNISIASASVTAGRYSNEDYINVDFIPDFEKFSVPIQKVVLQSWVNEIQKTLRAERKDDDDPGCTACVAITWVDAKGVLHNLTANLGDSHANAYLLDEKSHILKGDPISLSIPHKPFDEEKTRIESEGGTILWGRVNGNLNISRALGDFKYSPLVSDELTFEELHHPLEPHQKIVFFIACDGTDAMMKKDSDFHDILLKKTPINETAANVLKFSTETDMFDNTSFIILSYSPSDKPIPPIFSAVYDGHGGARVSKFVSENGITILKNKIQFALTLEGTEKLLQEETERKNETRLRILKKAQAKPITITPVVKNSFLQNIFGVKSKNPQPSFTVIPAKVDLALLLNKLRTYLHDEKGHDFLSLELVPNPRNPTTGLYRLTCKNFKAAYLFLDRNDISPTSCFDEPRKTKGIFSSPKYYLYFMPKSLEFLDEIITKQTTFQSNK